MGTNGRRGFTLIEVLIVIVIMAVLAATIIPQFSSSTRDAKDSSLNFNTHTMRSQIELYKVHHNGSYPDQIGDATNGYLPQLTKATNASGNTGDAGPSYPYGPYIEGDLPANARRYLERVEALAGVPVEMVSVGPSRDQMLVPTTS